MRRDCGVSSNIWPSTLSTTLGLMISHAKPASARFISFGCFSGMLAISSPSVPQSNATGARKDTDRQRRNAIIRNRPRVYVFVPIEFHEGVPPRDRHDAS